MSITTRLQHGDALIDRLKVDETTEVDTSSRYALVTQYADAGRGIRHSLAFGDDADDLVSDALAVLWDGWLPTELVDLDTGHVQRVKTEFVRSKRFEVESALGVETYDAHSLWEAMDQHYDEHPGQQVLAVSALDAAPAAGPASATGFTATEFRFRLLHQDELRPMSIAQAIATADYGDAVGFEVPGPSIPVAPADVPRYLQSLGNDGTFFDDAIAALDAEPDRPAS
jgi:hypothetical protein